MSRHGSDLFELGVAVCVSDTVLHRGVPRGRLDK